MIAEILPVAYMGLLGLLLSISTFILGYSIGQNTSREDKWLVKIANTSIRTYILKPNTLATAIVSAEWQMATRNILHPIARYAICLSLKRTLGRAWANEYYRQSIIDPCGVRFWLHDHYDRDFLYISGDTGHVDWMCLRMLQFRTGPVIRDLGRETSPKRQERTEEKWGKN